MTMKMMRMRLAIGFCGLIAMCWLVGPARAQSSGEAVYKSKCASCHSPDGSGSSAIGKQLKVPDLRSAETKKQTDAQLTDVTVNGKGKMPAFKGKLNDDEVKQVVAYIRDLAQKK